VREVQGDQQTTLRRAETGMIARVRIAPVDRWCDKLRHIDINPDEVPVGRKISILTETMRPSGWCEGVAWEHERSDCLAMRDELGLRGMTRPKFVCEHMLEMD
jgi:hypothetical protein